MEVAFEQLYEAKIEWLATAMARGLKITKPTKTVATRWEIDVVEVGSDWGTSPDTIKYFNGIQSGTSEVVNRVASHVRSGSEDSRDVSEDELVDGLLDLISDGEAEIGKLLYTLTLKGYAK